MRTRSTYLGLVLCATLVPRWVSAAEVAAGEENAALRYWMAFALMANPPVSADVAERLEQVAAGAQAWSSQLTPLLDQNREALAVLRRGTSLTRCDWGLETELGSDAPIAHLSRARSLARLNLVDGRRLLADGRSRDAVEAWLAGLRFSAHLAEQGPLLGAVVGSSAMEANLHALSDAVRAGTVDPSTMTKIASAITALPEGGVGWSAAVRSEVRTLSITLSASEGSADPASAIAAYLPRAGKQPLADELAQQLGLQPKQLADAQAVRGVLRHARSVLSEIEPRITAALRRPPGEALAELRAVDARARQAPVLSEVWPAIERIESSRLAVARARAELLKQLGTSTSE